VLCARAGEESEDRDIYADARLVQQTFPPLMMGHQVLIVDPDDDDRMIEDVVELAYVPGATVDAMVRLIDLFADRIRFDEEAHAATKRVPEDAGRNRSDFLALAPAPAAGIPMLERARLREVVTELRAFLAKVGFAGFSVEF
jgi:hypothetical protein